MSDHPEFEALHSVWQDVYGDDETQDLCRRDTFTEIEAMLRDDVDALRLFVHASRAAGLDTTVLVDCDSLSD